MDDLFKALQMFQTGVQQAATTAAVNDAADYMQQLNQSGLNESQKRQAQMQAANQLALKMVGTNANATQIEAAFKAVGPQQFATPEQAITQGVLSGNKQLEQLGAKAQDVLFQKDLKKAAIQMRMQEAHDTRRFQREYMMQMLKQSPEMAKAKAITGDELEKITSIDNSLTSASDLMIKVNQNSNLVGPLASRIPGRDLVDPNYAAFEADLGKFFDQYRVAVTGAGASEKELKMLEARLPSITDRPEIFTTKMQSAIDAANKFRETRLKNLGMAGRDVSKFVADRKAQEQKAAQQQQFMQFINQFLVK